MKHFINLKDIPASDLRKIISDAKKKKKKRKNLNTLDLDKDKPLKGKLLIQMFEKASLRTRLSFYLAIKQLGGDTLTLRANELHLGKGGESLADTAKILSTYGNGFMLRTDSDKKLEEFKKKREVFGFTDMIHMFIESGMVPKLDVVFVDEAQDLCKLQWRMIHKICQDPVRNMYISGDDDQAIFRWSGADVDKFISLEGNVTVLDAPAAAFHSSSSLSYPLFLLFSIFLFFFINLLSKYFFDLVAYKVRE